MIDNGRYVTINIKKQLYYTFINRLIILKKFKIFKLLEKVEVKNLT